MELAGAQKRLDSLKKEFEALRGQMGRVYKNVRHSDAQDAQNRLWESARDIEKKAEEALSDFYGSIQKQGRDVWQKGQEQVRKHPMAVVMGALVVGVVLGKITQRR